MKSGTQKLFLILLTIATAVYLVWRLGWTIPLDHGVVDIICALILLVVELMGIAEMCIHFYTQYQADSCRPEVPEWNEGELPEVDVFIPTCGEPAELLKKTLNGCLAMKYDDPKKVHIWLCDDKDSNEMKNLARGLGVGYFRRTEHENAKAGNLNAALKKTNAPLVAIFDADMCPKEDFLLKTVPYFLGKRVIKGIRSIDPTMGYVQTPQAFGNADLFQKAFCAEELIPNEQDYFYRNLELNRNKSNSVVFGGSNTLLSREALKSTGGLVTGTLTEDFATGIEIQKKGYRVLAIGEELAEGLSPESLESMIRQRSRWARGCIQAGRQTNFFFGKGLTPAQKMNCFSSVSYWYFPIKKLIYLLSPLLYAVGGIAVMRCDFRQMLVFWLPMYVLSTVGIRLFSGKIRTAKWSNIYETCLFPFLLIPVIKESVGIRYQHFDVTDKAGKKGWKITYTIPYLILIGFSVLGIANVISMSLVKQSWNYLFLLFWLCYNLYYLLFALLFVIRCRGSETDDVNIGFVHGLHKDSALKTNLIFIIIRSLKRKYFKKGNRV